MNRISLLTPPLPEQRAIAHVLGTLDDKLELNRRMNETLEEMARALFKSWFVDFDLVRAKMEGRDSGLPPEVAVLFSDRLVDSGLGHPGGVGGEGGSGSSDDFGWKTTAERETVGERANPRFRGCWTYGVYRFI